VKPLAWHFRAESSSIRAAAWLAALVLGELFTKAPLRVCGSPEPAKWDIEGLGARCAHADCRYRSQPFDYSQIALRHG